MGKISRPDTNWLRIVRSESTYLGDRPAARFYLNANPAYGEGYGLLTLFPIGAKMLATVAARTAYSKYTRAGGLELSRCSR